VLFAIDCRRSFVGSRALVCATNTGPLSHRIRPIQSVAASQLAESDVPVLAQLCGFPSLPLSFSLAANGNDRPIDGRDELAGAPLGLRASERPDLCVSGRRALLLLLLFQLKRLACCLSIERLARGKPKWPRRQVTSSRRLN